jgi:hypothetical protein
MRYRWIGVGVLTVEVKARDSNKLLPMTEAQPSQRFDDFELPSRRLGLWVRTVNLQRPTPKALSADRL